MELGMPYENGYLFIARLPYLHPTNVESRSVKVVAAVCCETYLLYISYISHINGATASSWWGPEEHGLSIPDVAARVSYANISSKIIPGNERERKEKEEREREKLALHVFLQNNNNNHMSTTNQSASPTQINVQARLLLSLPLHQSTGNPIQHSSVITTNKHLHSQI